LGTQDWEDRLGQHQTLVEAYERQIQGTATP